MNRVLVPLEINSVPPAEIGAVVHTLRGETMGTTWTVKFSGDAMLPRTELWEGIQGELDRVVAQMSTWLPESDLSKFNRARAGYWRSIPVEFAKVLDYALFVATNTGGAYDPTVGPLVNLWGFGPEHSTSRVPRPAEIDTAKFRCGWDKISLDVVGCRARQTGDVYLDFSSIAKGFGVDLVAIYLQQQGLSSYLVEVGGELRGFGIKPDGQPWWVALESPHPADGETDTIVALHGLSVATSGNYRRYFNRNGVRYSHTIDPRTGYPVAHALASITVLHPECMVADALSTALTVLGPDEGMAYALENNLAVLFIEQRETGFAETMTPALAAMLD